MPSCLHASVEHDLVEVVAAEPRDTFGRDQIEVTTFERDRRVSNVPPPRS